VVHFSGFGRHFHNSFHFLHHSQSERHWSQLCDALATRRNPSQRFHATISLSSLWLRCSEDGIPVSVPQANRLAPIGPTGSSLRVRINKYLGAIGQISLAYVFRRLNLKHHATCHPRQIFNPSPSSVGGIEVHNNYPHILTVDPFRVASVLWTLESGEVKFMNRKLSME